MLTDFVNSSTSNNRTNEVHRMGQYYLIINLDKRECLHPHRFGEGMKAREWLWSGSLCRALSVLLIDGDGRGGGDVNSSLCGRWAGDRIVIAGDYGDMAKFVDKEFLLVGTEPPNVFDIACEQFEDISKEVIELLASLGDEHIQSHPWTYKGPLGFKTVES